MQPNRERTTMIQRHSRKLHARVECLEQRLVLNQDFGPDPGFVPGENVAPVVAVEPPAEPPGVPGVVAATPRSAHGQQSMFAIKGFRLGKPKIPRPQVPKLPKAKVPKIKLPKARLPNVNVPKVPSIPKVPDIPNPFPNLPPISIPNPPPISGIGNPLLELAGEAGRAAYIAS